MNKRCVTLFAGGGGKSIGARLAGYELVSAIDNDPEAADAYRANLGDRIICGDLADLAQRAAVVAMAGGACDLLLASPPCQQYSQARAKSLARRADAEVGIHILDYVDDLQPAHVIIENVQGYKRAPVCRRLLVGLHARGYRVQARVIDFADYGVPQHRKRLIIQARRGPIRWPAKQRRIGWYAAIADLIPGLPDSAFAPWQLARLPAEMIETVMVDSHNTGQEWGKRYRTEIEPSHTVVALSRPSHLPTAYVVDGKANDAGRRVTTAPGDAPIYTVPASAHKQMPRAVLVGGGNTNSTIIDSKARPAEEPSFTITGSSARDRLAIPGRVVKFTPRCLARLQTFPDWYVLPVSATAACRIIGNAVPCRGMEALLLAYETPPAEALSMAELAA